MGDIYKVLRETGYKKNTNYRNLKYPYILFLFKLQYLGWLYPPYVQGRQPHTQYA